MARGRRVVERGGRGGGGGSSVWTENTGMVDSELDGAIGGDEGGAGGG